ncbi:unnamed protein product [Urochloa decumbens]|uniref:PDZ domain-containing protein n=1 Tax=Urochloa decumbens TaxID=240449 RepID=A0ABC8Z3Z3_9POAL
MMSEGGIEASPRRSEEGSEEPRPGKRKIDERGQIAPSPAEVSAVVQLPGKASAATAGEGYRASAVALRPRYPPYPKGGKVNDVRKWAKECKRVNEILRKDMDFDIPTMSKPKDPYTTKAVQSSRDKVVVLRAARSIVSVSYIMDDGQRLPRCTGIIIKQLPDSGRHRAIIVTYSRVVCKAGRKLDPLPKLSVTLPDKKTLLDAELIYFNDHYDIALLEVYLDYPLELPSIGLDPEYGEELFVLARDGEVSLRVRCGNIKWLEESSILGRDYYMFLSCDIPEGGNGGMVIDHDGRVRGMAVYWSPHPAVISISIIEKCIDMFMHYDRVARPVLGIRVRTIALLDVQRQEDISDFGINAGFLVDEVYNPVAEQLGIRCGNVITSINGQGVLTLPELEHYLLSLGSDYLQHNSICMKDFKLRVFDLKRGVAKDVTLPIRFYDKAERDEEFYRMG